MAASDADLAAQWIVRELPAPAPLARALPVLLARLIVAETLRGVVAEHFDGDAQEPAVVGLGISGFLDERAVLDYLARPYPHFEIDLLDRCRRGRSCTSFLTYDEIAEGNAGEGVTLFPLIWLQRTTDPADPESRTVLTLGQQAFLRTHRGYRLVRILKETPAERAEAYLNGGFRERCRIPAGTALRLPGKRLQCDHVVLEVTRSQIEAAMPGSAVGPLFAHRPPCCGFSRAEKQVLSRAADGLTDAQIARNLGISPAAVAMRWRSIYMRIASRVPSALQDAGPAPAGRGRGNEKRRRVIAFLADYPEEMRPYASS
jgi:DNA-binding CsgD family transcriptional regulator